VFGGEFHEVPAMIFWPFLALVIIVPIPFGSIYPWSSTLISAFTGVLLFGWAVQAAFDRSQPAIGLKQTWPFILPVVLVAAWICIQIAPWTPESWHHPLWKSTGEILGEKLESRISLDPNKSATGLMRLLTYGGIFWLALQYGKDAKNARRMIVSLAVMGVLCAVYGLAMEFSGANLILWYEKEFYFGSVTSVFHYKNSYATYAAMGMLCVLGLLMEAIAARGGIEAGRAEKRRQLFTWLAEEGWVPALGIIALAFALVLTNSRAGLVSGALGILTLLCMLQISHMRHAPYIRSLAALSFAAILAFFIIGGDGFWRKIDSINPERDVRADIRASTIRAIRDVPWTGMGSGTYEGGIAMYHPENLPRRVVRAHNSYLENAMELGIPAAILMCLAIAFPAIWCARGVWRRRRHGVYPLIAVAVTVTIAAHALLDFTMQVPAVAVTYFALLGTGCAQSWNS
jgi:hypothetical protein